MEGIRGGWEGLNPPQSPLIPLNPLVKRTNRTGSYLERSPNIKTCWVARMFCCNCPCFIMAETNLLAIGSRNILCSLALRMQTYGEVMHPRSNGPLHENCTKIKAIKSLIITINFALGNCLDLTLPVLITRLVRRHSLFLVAYLAAGAHCPLRKARVSPSGLSSCEGAGRSA
jgi:hypothetical protein